MTISSDTNLVEQANKNSGPGAPIAWSDCPKISSAADGARDIPFTRALLLSTYHDVVNELGGKPESLLEEAEMDPRRIQHPLSKVPLHKVGTILEHTAVRLGCADLGLRLAERQPMQVAMQPLDRLFCAAPTIRDAFQCGSRHITAFNSGMIMELEEEFEPGGGFLHFQLLDGLALFPQLIEQLLLLSHHSAIFLSAGFARSRAVWFSHLNLSPPVAYARRFNAVVKFGQEYDGLFLGENDLKARVAECNEELFAREERLVAEQFPTFRKGLHLQVRLAVFRLLIDAEDCNRQNVARLLGLQERTLNRRLSKKGTSFEAIRDDVRRSLAYRYLSRDDLSLTEIAGRLGYSELAVLSRSCRRWFGAPPRALRQTLFAGQPAPPFRRTPVGLASRAGDRRLVS